MSSSFPQFSVDEIILKHDNQESQDLNIMIIQSDITLTTAKQGVYSIII